MVLRNKTIQYATRSLLTAILALVFPLTYAQEPIPVEVTSTAELREDVVAPGGRTDVRFVPAHSLQQGDQIYFTLRIRNVTPVVAPEVTVTWPIPANTQYEEGSASGPAAEISFSADGGATFGSAKEVQRRDATGAIRTARPDEYTHIRWRLRYSLAPGAVAIARFRAIFQ